MLGASLYGLAQFPSLIGKNEELEQKDNRLEPKIKVWIPTYWSFTVGVLPVKTANYNQEQS